MSLFPTYARFDVTIAKTEGTTITDTAGKTYTDFGAGIGVCNLGHNHPKVKAAVENQLNQYWHVSNLYHQPIQEEVADLITENSVADYVFFCNSGAEANEAAIKLARKHTGKHKIITFAKSFHGRTFATMAATGQDKIHQGFGPLLSEFVYASYNDLDSVKALVDDETAAVMLEVVQGEGGVNPGNKAFIQALAQLCEQEDILLIVDEIQTGIGRTGSKFAYEQYDIEPDIFTLAKGLGNGLPVGAMAAKAGLGETFGPGAHGSTFGGNPLAMAAAKAVLTEIFAEGFLQELHEKTQYLQDMLQTELANEVAVKDIRQLGMMVGIEINGPAIEKVKQLLDEGLIVLSAGENVIRLLPPLTVTTEEIANAIVKIKEVL